MDTMCTVVSTKHNFVRFNLFCFLLHKPILTRLCNRRDGVLRTSDLGQIWRAPKYPAVLHQYLLSLLERFELMFPIKDYAHKLGAVSTEIVYSFHTSRTGNLTFIYELDFAKSENEEISRVAPGDLRSYLVPSLLPLERPVQFGSMWPSKIRTHK